MDSIDDNIIPGNPTKVKMAINKKPTKKPFYERPWVYLATAACAATAVVCAILPNVLGSKSKDELAKNDYTLLEGKQNQIGFGISSAINAVNGLGSSGETVKSRNGFRDDFGDDYGEDHDGDDWGEHDDDHGEHFGHGWDFEEGYSKEKSEDDAKVLINVLNPYLSSIAAKTYGEETEYSLITLNDDSEYQYKIGNFYFSFVEEDLEELELEDDEFDNDLEDHDHDGEELDDIKDEGPESVEEPDLEIDEHDDDDIDDVHLEAEHTYFTIKGVLLQDENSLPVEGEYYKVSSGENYLECLDLYVRYSEDELLVVSQYSFNEKFYREHYSNTYFKDKESETSQPEVVEEQISFDALSFATYNRVESKHHEGKYHYRPGSYIEFDSISHNDKNKFFASVDTNVTLDEIEYELMADLEFSKGEDSENKEVVSRYNLQLNSHSSFGGHDHFHDGWGFGFRDGLGRRNHGKFSFKFIDGEYALASETLESQGSEEIIEGATESLGFDDWFDID